MFIVQATQLCLFYRLHATYKVTYLVTFLDALANCEKRLLASVCLSVRMEKLGSN